jgi:hypothetical protein
MICYPQYLIVSPRNIGLHTSSPEYASTADISTTPTSLQSWFSYIGMHNYILEYASTTSISTVMSMPLHVKPFEKKVSKEVIFLIKYHQKPQVLKRRSIEKREKKVLKKEKKKKRGRKRKAPRVSSNKGEVNILVGEKHFNFKNLLLM